MAYTTIDDPTIYFNTVLYTGNASTQSITGVGFSPSFVWIKSRNDTNENYLFDVIRGVHEPLISSANTAETTDTNTVTSFDSDGFSIGNNTGINGSSDTEVAWNWKAGTSFTNDASSTGIGTIDSTGSASDTAGFSIVSYTGTGSAGTIKHGLSTAPNCIIFKNRDSASNWIVYHSATSSTPQDDFLKLNANSAVGSSTSYGNNTAPTTSVFSVGANDNTNKSSEGQIAYCFAEKQGYSKFGSYIGNGSADAPFIHTGFKPAMVILKEATSTGNWYIFDNKRNTFNLMTNALFPDEYIAETTDNAIDFYSNGFKGRKTSSDLNTSGNNHIYIAFAESPFTNSSGVPNNAR